jgi:hypothetical protein
MFYTCLNFPFLGAEPSFRDFIIACKKVVIVTAGYDPFVRKLHPPTARFFALKEDGIHFGEGRVVFVEVLAVL